MNTLWTFLSIFFVSITLYFFVRYFSTRERRIASGYWKNITKYSLRDLERAYKYAQRLQHSKLADEIFGRYKKISIFALLEHEPERQVRSIYWSALEVRLAEMGNIKEGLLPFIPGAAGPLAKCTPSIQGWIVLLSFLQERKVSLLSFKEIYDWVYIKGDTKQRELVCPLLPSISTDTPDNILSYALMFMRDEENQELRRDLEEAFLHLQHTIRVELLA